MRVLTAGYSFFVEDDGKLYKLFANGIEHVTPEFTRASELSPWIHVTTRIVLSHFVRRELRQPVIDQYLGWKNAGVLIQSPRPAIG